MAAAAAAGGRPPAALLAFLGGEAPSEAALRRPDTATSTAGRPMTPVPVLTPSGPSSSSRCKPVGTGARARRRGEESSDSDGAPPDDGGFDGPYDDRRAPIPEAQPLSTSANAISAPAEKEKDRDRDKKAAKPPRQKVAEGSSSHGSSGAYPVGRSQADLGKTFTPSPAGLSLFMGEDTGSPRGRRGSTPQRPTGSGDSSHSGASAGPRSGSRQRAGERSETPTRVGGSAAPPGSSPKVAGARELDPMGSSARRRFGGRG
mmetsp:Transcript_93166/g.251536  ORF Transcript_93166/g.251536 Transcript_93166/m.251536 type:complete len:260 (-) Transcript_93166:63-842(-)